MLWTQASFALEAERLLDVVRRTEEESTVTGTHTDCLALWKLVGKGNQAEVTSSFIRTHSGSVEAECNNLNCSPDSSDVEVLFMDDTVISDEDVIFTAGKAEHGVLQLRWHFSIVYSPTWQCPILFFRVEQLDGTVVTSRESVLRMLKSQHHQNHVEDTWEFVSQDDHPIHNTPFFFLHPCQTQERMKILTNAAETHEHPPGCYLLSWMSMILHAVGVPIPSKTFVAMRKKLMLLQA